jgi:hypothetical protein
MHTNELSDSPAAGDSANFLWNVQHSEQGDRRGQPSPANEARGSDPRSFLHRESDDHFQSWDDICYWHDLLTRLNSPLFQGGPANQRQPGPATHGGKPAGTSYRRHRECAQCSTKYLPRQCRCSLCNEFWYCSKECQRTHWNAGNHRYDCDGVIEYVD